MGVKRIKPLALLLIAAFMLTGLPLQSAAAANASGTLAINQKEIPVPAVAPPKSIAETIDTKAMSPDIARIIDRGSLIVATTITDQPPLFWKNADGKLCGVDFELAQGLADALGVKLSILRWSDNFSELQNAVISGEADLIIGSYSNTLSRAMYLSFSDVYLSVNYGVMVNSSKLIQHGIEEDPVGYILENKVKIGVLGGSSHVRALQTLFPDCETVEVFLEPGDPYANAYDKAAYMVVNGELFAYFCVELEFVLQYMTLQDLSIYTTAFSFTDIRDSYTIGVNKNDMGLLEFVNLYLRQRKADSVTDIIASFVKQTEGAA